MTEQQAEPVTKIYLSASSQPPILSSKRSVLLMIEKHPKLADSTKAKYSAVVLQYLNDGHSLTDSQALRTYAAGLSHTRRAHLSAAVNLWAKATIDDVRSQATPDNVRIVDATIHRLTSVQSAVKVEKRTGTKTHTWLTRPEVTRLMDAARAREGNAGFRDVVALALLLGAGLRRTEAVQLRFDDIIQQGDRVVLGVMGKGDKQRTVPISITLGVILADWRAVAGDGFILRRVSQVDEIGGGLSDVALFNIVRSYGRQIGHEKLAPHDLRRTYAHLGYDAGVPITQISVSLGHEDVGTTQRYLNVQLDLETAVSDYIPL